MANANNTPEGQAAAARGYVPDKVARANAAPVEKEVHALCLGVKLRTHVRDGKEIVTASALIIATGAVVSSWGPMTQEDGTPQSGIKVMPDWFIVDFEDPDDLGKIARLIHSVPDGQTIGFPRNVICKIASERPVQGGPTKARGRALQLGEVV